MIGQDHEEKFLNCLNYNLSVGQTSAWFHDSEANDPDLRSKFPYYKTYKHNSLSQNNSTDLNKAKN